MAREDAGLRIDDVAARLRVPRSMILAIEAGAVSALPKAPYIGGHWRSYAALVGVRLPRWDPVRDAPEGPPEAAATPEVQQDALLAAAGMPRGRRPYRLLLAVVLLLGAVGALAALLGDDVSGAPGEEAPLVAVPPRVAVAEPVADPVAEPPAPRPVAPAAAAPVPEPAAPAEVRASVAPPMLRFVARGEVWVQLSIPTARRTLVARVLEAGEVVSVPLEPGMELTVGAPQHIAVFVDALELSLQSFIQRGTIRGVRVSRLVAGV